MLQINDLTYRVESRVLFDKATASLSEGWKVGFVGRNGAGKSTLFRLIKGEISPDDGAVSVRPGRRIGALEQEAPATSDSLVDIVLSFDEERARLVELADREEDPEKLADLHTRLSDIDAHSAEARAATILAGLGFSAKEQAQAAHDFSGGWRMRVAMAGLLFASPDLLLLDEPTNYLDIEGVIWLESFLKRFPYSSIVISHDQDFLNRCATHILALDDRKLSVHTGNYDVYARKRAEQRAQDLAAKARIDAQRKHMQAFVDRFRAKASKAKQAQSRLKAIEKLGDVVAPNELGVAPFSFGSPTPMAPPIVRLADADLGYETTSPVLKKLNLRIDQDDRIVILGANGQGKSTLVKSVSSRTPVLSGNLFKHKKLKVAYFSQHQTEELHANQTPLDHIKAARPESTEAQARSLAAQVGFGKEKADTKVRDMSGGEKARLLLALIGLDAPHLLILDEPTNHLDVDSREALADGLNAYEGAVILITHDAHLASLVGERLWLVKDQKVTPFDGDLEDYRRLILSERRRDRGDKSDADPKPSSSTSRIDKRVVSAKSRENIAPLKKDAAVIEARLEELNGILLRLDEALADPDLYHKDVARATKLQRERKALTDAILDAEEEWLAALEAIENASDITAATQTP
ncbi:MAG: ABC-F family ATP-binding cassette domain-containing protein [Pseudomonadota bacterium]